MSSAADIEQRTAGNSVQSIKRTTGTIYGYFSLILHKKKIYVVGTCTLTTNNIWPGSVAQLDARLTGDQEGVSSQLRSSSILSLRLIMKSFLQSFSPFR